MRIEMSLQFHTKKLLLFFRTSFLNPANTCLLHREYVYDSHTLGITNAININMIINSKLLQAQSWTRVLTVLLTYQSCSSPASGTSWERNNIMIPNESKYMKCSLFLVTIKHENEEWNFNKLTGHDYKPVMCCKWQKIASDEGRRWRCWWWQWTRYLLMGWCLKLGVDQDQLKGLKYYCSKV